jgi:hypothetical protein
MARKADEADNFVFVQVTEQEHRIYGKCHADFAWWDKIYLALEGISHGVKESGSCFSTFEII